MEQPSKEDVEQFIQNRAAITNQNHYQSWTHGLAVAYLALREEVKAYPHRPLTQCSGFENGGVNNTTKEAVMQVGDKVRLIGGINLTEDGKRTYFDYPGNEMIVDDFIDGSVAIIEPKEGLMQFVTADRLELVSD